MDKAGTKAHVAPPDKQVLWVVVELLVQEVQVAKVVQKEAKVLLALKGEGEILVKKEGIQNVMYIRVVGAKMDVDYEWI